jgi:histidinol-phosphate aminotransferase
MAPQPLPNILAIKPYKGGSSALPGAVKAIKLSSNENPLGCSPAASAAAQAALHDMARYPDGAHCALRRAIAARCAIPEEQVICGAGSDEVFQFLGRAYLAPGDNIVQSQYAFLMYRLMAQAAGAEVRSAPDRRFHADVDGLLARVDARTKLVFLANPNNPTGTYVPASEIARLQRSLPPQVLLVLDGAYAEYVDAPDYEDGVALARRTENVLVTRTFSKIHGLASLRIGWAFGAPDVIDALNRVRGPFNVTGPALAAAAAAIGDEAFAQHSAAFNRAELARVSTGLEALGFSVVPSVCNFVLVQFGSKSAAEAADAHLRQAGLIVRDVAAYGLPDALRISLGLPEQNDQVLATLARFPHGRAA